MADPDMQGAESITQSEHVSPAKTGDNVEAKRVVNYVWNGSSWERQGLPEGSAIYITILRTDTLDPQITYVGKALPGTATSDSAWQIASLDENTNLDLLYADGGAFTQVYDDREGLTYA